MRKLLLGTTAVAGAALLAVSTAQAQQAPTVRIGGYIDFSYGFINDNGDVNQVAPSYPGVAPANTTNTLSPATTANRRLSRTDMRSDAEIHVFVTGQAANGLAYGATIELEMDAAGNTGSATGLTGSGTTFNTDEMFIFVSSPTLGTVRLGDEDSAGNLMQVRVPTLSTNGTGPASGRWTEFMSGGGAGTSAGPARYMITSMNDGGDRTKVVYLSPQFAGFDFGVSFSPNGGEGERERFGVGVAATGVPNAGQAALQRGLTSTQNEVTAALRYRGTFGGVGIAAGAAYTRADAQTVATSIARRHDGTFATGLQDPDALALGLTLSAFGFTVGGEYMTGKFSAGSGGGGAIAQGRDASTSWAMGVTYTAGALSVGAFYAGAKSDTSTVAFASTSTATVFTPATGATAPGTTATTTTTTNTAARGDRTQAVIGLGVEYLIAPGLTGFANYANVQDKNLEAAYGNRAAGQSRNIDFFSVGVTLAF